MVLSEDDEKFLLDFIHFWQDIRLFLLILFLVLIVESHMELPKVTYKNLDTANLFKWLQS